MNAPKFVTTPPGGNTSSFHNCHHTPTNYNHDLSHFQNIFPAPPKNSLRRSTRSETHLTDMRNFAHPSEKAICPQVHQKMAEFICNEELMKNTRLPGVSSTSSLRKFCDKKGCSNESIEKCDQTSLYTSFHPLSSLLLRGKNSSNQKNINSLTISEERESDIVEVPIKPRIRRTSSASHIEYLIQDLSLLNTTESNNMLSSKDSSQVSNIKLNQDGLTMTLDKAKSTSSLATNVENSVSSNSWFTKPENSSTINKNAKELNDSNNSSSTALNKSGSVLGFFGKGIFGQPVPANKSETTRYILTLEQ
uniref:Uncharacterized protein n=1 Tax=Parastrongyloides trichosuri TaxID=131310 RepID=A0A0N4ZBZ2_PARTI